jgi:hypothetical protein
MHFRRPKNSTPSKPSGVMSPRGVLRHEIESELDFILKAWFPRTIDTEYGGFLSDFDYRWRPRGPQHKQPLLQREPRVSRSCTIPHYTGFGILKK